MIIQHVWVSRMCSFVPSSLAHELGRGTGPGEEMELTSGFLRHPSR